MKKVLHHYLIIWLTLLVIFNLAAFAVNGWNTYEKYTASFWVGYAIITVAFAGHLFCAYTALAEKNLTKQFYRIPLIRISYIGLFLTFLLGGACMLLAPVPYWTGAVLAAIVLVATAISAVKADAAASVVGEIDEKISKQTAFVRNMTAEAEALLLAAKTSEEKALCKKVYEALRYSNPVSNEAVAELEARIKIQFEVFSAAVSSGSGNHAEADELLRMIKERSNKCKRQGSQHVTHKLSKEELRIQKEEKIAVVITPFVCAALVFMVVLSTVIIPNRMYENAVTLMDAGKYESAAAIFEKLNGLNDSEDLLLICRREILEKEYKYAVALMNAGKYEDAIAAFEALNGYKDSVAQIAACKKAPFDEKYADAVNLKNAGKYEEAIAAFEALNGYKDSAAQIAACKAGISERAYQTACDLFERGQNEDAYAAFEKLTGYKDSSAYMQYIDAKKLQSTGEIADAAIAFGKLNDFKDSKALSDTLWAHIAARETIAAGAGHSAAVKADGSVVAAGSNADGQCEVSGWENVIAVSTGANHTVGLKEDGTVLAAGSNLYGQCDVSGWTDIVTVSAGWGHTVGLKKDGTVVATGYNKNGECNVQNWTDIIAVSAGENHTVGLKSDGSVVATGTNDDRLNVSEWKDIVAISAGGEQTVGMMENGAVVSTKAYDFGSDVIAICAGYRHAVALKADGTVVSTAEDENEWTDVIAISAGDGCTIGLKADGTVVATGNNGDVSGWTNIKRPG